LVENLTTGGEKLRKQGAARNHWKSQMGAVLRRKTRFESKKPPYGGWGEMDLLISANSFREGVARESSGRLVFVRIRKSKERKGVRLNAPSRFGGPLRKRGSMKKARSWSLQWRKID